MIRTEKKKTKKNWAVLLSAKRQNHSAGNNVVQPHTAMFKVTTDLYFYLKPKFIKQIVFLISSHFKSGFCMMLVITLKDQLEIKVVH